MYFSTTRMEGGQKGKTNRRRIFDIKMVEQNLLLRFECMVELMNNKCIVYHKKGLEIETCSAKTDHLQYHGEFKERQIKESWGIEYDVERAGIWLQMVFGAKEN